MQKTEFIGNLGSDAELKELDNTKVINFSVAATEKWKTKEGEQKENTTWYECSQFTTNAGVLPYLKKGTRVYVSGKSVARAYIDKDGKAVPVNGITVRGLELIGSVQDKPKASNTDNAEDLPF